MTTIYFATNRTEPTAKGRPFGNRFHKEGPHFYRVGEAEVTWTRPGTGPRDRDWDAFDVTWALAPERRPVQPAVTGVPETHRKTDRGEKPGSRGLFDKLRTEMVDGDCDALIFIHGFANSFDSGIARAAQLKESYLITPFDENRHAGTPYQPVTFAFSWPSDGAVQPPWKYASDRDDAALSGLAMARALRRLVAFLSDGERCERKIHLVAHSMGNWALRHAVQGLRGLVAEQRLDKIFDNVFLMAADEDDDALEHDHKLRPLLELARAIHIYHSQDDIALQVSDKTKFNQDRLGANGPRTFSGLSSRVTAVDCVKADFTEIDHGKHQYYRLRPKVIGDVRHVLSGRFRPDEVPGRRVIESGRRYRIET